jgi:hypothetical protein
MPGGCPCFAGIFPLGLCLVDLDIPQPKQHAVAVGLSISLYSSISCRGLISEGIGSGGGDFGERWGGLGGEEGVKGDTSAELLVGCVVPIRIIGAS